MATKETGKRSLFKAITWRLVGAIDTAAISWVVTGDPLSGLNMGLADVAAKIVFYIIHEQLWNYVNVEKHKSLQKHKNRRLHWLKAVTWRIFSSGITVVLGWLILHNPLTGLKIAVIEIFTKIILYYFHERLWIRSNYGLKNKT